MRDYHFKTKPFVHQKEAFEISRDLDAFALHMEQGTGKTKVVIDSAAWLYGKGQIDGVLVIAPNGVHRNWILREIPLHMPDYVRVNLHAWNGSSKTKATQKSIYNVFAGDGLSILAMNVEALSRKKGFIMARDFLRARRCLTAVDESTRIKNPGSKRTKNILKLRDLTPYRRTLSGTPITKGPFDLFAPFRFLDPDIIGFDNYYVFKHYFAIWEKKFDRKAINKRTKKPGVEYDSLVDYANLDELKSLVGPYVYRVKKSECLDLPPKIYQTVPIDLTREQAKLYREMETQKYVDFEGFEVLGQIALVELMRLQQITGGFLPVEDPTLAEGDNWRQVAKPIPGKNPKLEALANIVEDGDGKTIIWARFRPEIDIVTKRLIKDYGPDTVVQYHGGVKQKDRDHAIDSFQDPCSPVRFFIGQQQSGGIGLTLNAAETVLYYSNLFDYELRAQSEDRAHRIGVKKPVLYVDLEAEGTVDARVNKVLHEKKGLADYIVDDVEITKEYAKPKPIKADPIPEQALYGEALQDAVDMFEQDLLG